MEEIMTCIGPCIESTHFRDKKVGYARKLIPGTKKVTHHHRWVYEQHHGPIPEGMVVRHKCDNPPCINIEHLEIGTHQDNMNDMVIRGRARWGENKKRGEENGKAKLTEKEVREIRNLKGKISQSKIAKQFSIHLNTVKQIHQNKTWTHIT